MQTDKQRMCVAPRHRFPAVPMWYWSQCKKDLSATLEMTTARSAIKTPRRLGYLSKMMTKLSIKIHMESNSSIETAFPWILRLSSSISDKPFLRKHWLNRYQISFLDFLYRARRHSTRIASYLRRMSTTLCIKIHMKSDSSIESAFP